MKKKALCFLLIILSTTLSAQVPSWEELKKRAEQYNASKDEKGKQNEKIPNLVSEKPKATERFIDTETKPLDEREQRHITFHMKSANISFAKRDYSKAVASLNQVFEVQPENSGARFMKAVIAAREKDYLVAWHNILIAKKYDSNNQKIEEFINNLNKAMPQPSKMLAVPDIYREIPQHLSEKLSDVFEYFLKQQESKYLILMSVLPIKSTANQHKIDAILEFSAPPNKKHISKIFETATQQKVAFANSTSDKILNIGFSIAELPKDNPEPKVASNFSTHIETLAEEFDIAIKHVVEQGQENSHTEAIYNLAFRDFSSLNSFLRKLSPYLLSYQLQEITLAILPGTGEVIWEGKVILIYTN